MVNWNKVKREAREILSSSNKPRVKIDFPLSLQNQSNIEFKLIYSGSKKDKSLKHNQNLDDGDSQDLVRFFGLKKSQTFKIQFRLSPCSLARYGSNPVDEDDFDILITFKEMESKDIRTNIDEWYHTSFFMNKEWRGSPYRDHFKLKLITPFVGFPYYDYNEYSEKLLNLESLGFYFYFGGELNFESKSDEPGYGFFTIKGAIPLYHEFLQFLGTKNIKG
jgi:hypothetical protein